MVPTEPKAVTPPSKTVDPLSILLPSAPTEMGSITVTKKEDHLLGEGDVISTKPGVRPPQDESGIPSEESTPKPKDDVKFMAPDVGDTMEEI